MKISSDKTNRLVDFLPLFLLAAVTGGGSELFGASFFELRKAAIEGGRYLGTNHDPFLLIDNETERLQHTTNMLMDVDLACLGQDQLCFFWNNAVNSKATNHQYRSVEWSYRLGFSLSDKLEFGWDHMSRHMLDGISEVPIRFPLENTFYVQFKWLDNPRRPRQ